MELTNIIMTAYISLIISFIGIAIYALHMRINRIEDAIIKAHQETINDEYYTAGLREAFEILQNG